LTVLRDVVSRFAAAGGVANMNSVSQIEMLDHGGDVGGVVLHVVAVAHLCRATMAAPVMRDDAVALAGEVGHLRIPIVAAQRPPMVENDRLGAPGAPVLVKDFRAVLGSDGAHCSGSCARGSCLGWGSRR